MNRRDATTILFAFGAARAFGAHAQSKLPSQSKLLGVLSIVSAQDAKRLWLDRMLAELKTTGWIEGQNLVIELAFADYDAARLPALAEALVRKRVDILWAFPEQAAIAAARATKTIPIVFVNVPWPVEQGLIDSFARPGRNATGVASYTGVEVSTKRLEYLKEVAPTATRLAWIQDSTIQATVEGGGFDIRPFLDVAARQLGYEVRHFDISNHEALDRVFAGILDWRAHAIAVAGSPAVFAARERIAAFALRNRLPSACASSTLVDAGGLLSYNAAGGFTEAIVRSIAYVDRLLRGVSPADLPVSRPQKYELVINLRTAKALGLQIPRSVLLQIDRVIQ